MNKVALLYICIGNYTKFWPGFYTSFEEKFLPNSHKEYFVFTDSDNLEFADNNQRVHLIYQEDLGWPKNTLYRFFMFKRIEEQLKEFDYCFYINANIVCKDIITEEEFLPVKEDLLVVKHPYFFNAPPKLLPYEKNIKSSAYIFNFFKTHKNYYAGGVQGGKVSSYFKLINKINKNIKKDERKGIVAIWNDESHLNKYISTINKNKVKVLNSSYAYPEEKNLDIPIKLFILDKKRYIEIDEEKRKKDQESRIKQRNHKTYIE